MIKSIQSFVYDPQWGHISSIFSINSGAFDPELIENIEESTTSIVYQKLMCYMRENIKELSKHALY